MDATTIGYLLGFADPEETFIGADCFGRVCAAEHPLAPQDEWVPLFGDEVAGVPGTGNSVGYQPAASSAWSLAVASRVRWSPVWKVPQGIERGGLVSRARLLEERAGRLSQAECPPFSGEAYEREGAGYLYRYLGLLSGYPEPADTRVWPGALFWWVGAGPETPGVLGAPVYLASGGGTTGAGLAHTEAEDVAFRLGIRLSKQSAGERAAALMRWAVRLRVRHSNLLSREGRIRDILGRLPPAPPASSAPETA